MGFLACAKDLDDRVVGGAERRWPWLGKPRDAHARAPSLLPMLIVGAVVFWVFAARGAPVGAAALTWTVFAVWAAVLVIRGRRTQGAAPRQMHSERVGRSALAARGRRRCPRLRSGRTGRRHGPCSVAAVSASPEPPHPNRRTRLRAAERDRRVRRPSGRHIHPGRCRDPAALHAPQRALLEQPLRAACRSVRQPRLARSLARAVADASSGAKKKASTPNVCPAGTSASRRAAHVSRFISSCRVRSSVMLAASQMTLPRPGAAICLREPPTGCALHEVRDLRTPEAL